MVIAQPPPISAAQVAALPAAVVSDWLRGRPPTDLRALRECWPFWARSTQLPPPGDWSTWLLLGGRGAGKTRAGAEFVRHMLERGGARRIALVAPTLDSGRAVMVEGESGLLNLSGPRPVFQSSLNRLQWPNGAQAHLFSAQEPDRLRGPQFDCAWGDEACYWPDLSTVLSTLRMAMRLGQRPRLVLTTTPRGTPALRALLAEPDTVVTTSASVDNRAALSANFVANARRRFGDGASAAQELEGRVDWMDGGALWTRALIANARISIAPPLDRIVVAVDPPASSGPHADACGIVAAGVHGEGDARCGFVLADHSFQPTSPLTWATAACDLAREIGASAIVAEVNMGGDMVSAMLHLADPRIPIRTVRATTSKRDRAAPIAVRYAQRRVFHVGVFPALEDEMVSFDGADPSARSPDRLDALVWALTDLFGDCGAPRLRRL